MTSAERVFTDERPAAQEQERAHMTCSGGDAAATAGIAVVPKQSTAQCDEAVTLKQAHPVMTAFCIDKTAALAAQLKNDVPRPQPLAKEALIRVLRAGICGTDLAMMNNYKPGFEGALGHEFVGIVVQVGSGGDADQWLHKRVVGEINIPCDNVVQCRVCRVYHDAHARDRPRGSSVRDPKILYRNHCPHRHALGIVGRSGAFSEFITLPLANLLVVPDHVPDSDAVFTEPLAAAYRILEQDVIRPTDSVAVLGDGRLGLLVAEVIAVEKAARRVSLIGKHVEKLALAASTVDATLVNCASSNTSPAFDDVHCEAFDVVVECTGTSSGIASALRIVRPRGRIIVKSTCAQAKSEIPHEALAEAARKSVSVVGSRCGPFAPALAAIAAKRVKVAKYLAATYPLAHACDAVAHAKQRGVLKIQLDLAWPSQLSTPSGSSTATRDKLHASTPLPVPLVPITRDEVA